MPIINGVKLYRITGADGKVSLDPKPGIYAGWNGKRLGRLIFGTLDCASGKRKILPKNRVFFHSWADAIAAGYRPCKLCKPRQ